MLSNDIKQAIREWDAEVDREAVRLIREGTPPFDAVEQARKNVERRRKAKAHVSVKGER